MFVVYCCIIFKEEKEKVLLFILPLNGDGLEPLVCIHHFSAFAGNFLGPRSQSVTHSNIIPLSYPLSWSVTFSNITPSFLSTQSWSVTFSNIVPLSYPYSPNVHIPHTVKMFIDQPQ